MMTMVV